MMWKYCPVFFVLLACQVSADPNPPNVILVMVDTLRADALGGAHDGKKVTPNLDAFAARGVTFEQAYSQAGCTFPSVNSLLTSRYPFPFIQRETASFEIPGGMPTLADMLKQRGYTTLAVSASPIVRKSPSNQNPDGGFGHGFDAFIEEGTWEDAPRVNARALKLLDGVSGSFFLYLHYMDPHDPYHDHREGGASETVGEVRPFIAQGDPNPIADWLYAGGDDPRLTAEELEHLRQLYRSEVSWFDRHFGELLDALQERGHLEHSIIAVVSDHGEAFMEHRDIKHCHSLYNSLVHVPLMIRFPADQYAGTRVDGRVENLSVVPTLLDALGFLENSGRFDGVSLLPAVARGERVSRPVFGQQFQYRFVADESHKLIVDRNKGTYELFSLLEDPEEQRPLDLEENAGVFGPLKKALDDWERSRGGRTRQHDPNAERVKKRLRSLGYLR